MQTPGSQITPMTSMVDSPAKRMNAAYERLLIREQEDSGGKGATVRALGSLLVSFEKVNSEMKVIRRDIRRDLREKRKYHSAETKLLKKEKNVLEGLQSSVTNFRKILGGAAFALAARDASQGNFGSAASNALVGGAALFPEIKDIIVSVLGGLGLLNLVKGGKSGGGVPITGNASRGLLSKIPKSGMGKWGALGLTALSLLTLPSLLGGSANAQQVVSGESRRERVIAGEQPDIINRRDTNRFSGQLDKFDGILRALSGDDKDVKPKDTKGPKIEPAEGIIPFKDDPLEVSDTSDNSSNNKDNNEYTGQRNKWQRFFDPAQIFSKDDPEEERTGEDTGGRPRILDPAILKEDRTSKSDTNNNNNTNLNPSKKKKIVTKQIAAYEKKLADAEIRLEQYKTDGDTNRQSGVNRKIEFYKKVIRYKNAELLGYDDLSSEIEGFNKKDQGSKFYKQPPIINKLKNGETLENGNKIEIINNSSEIDPLGPQGSILNSGGNFSDSAGLFVDPNFYLSSDKMHFRLLMNQPSAMT